MTSAGKSAESSSQQPSSSSSGALSKPTPKQEEIIKGFQKLRQEQHAMSEKVSEIKSQISEHKSVIAALEKVTMAAMLTLSSMVSEAFRNECYVSLIAAKLWRSY